MVLSHVVRYSYASDWGGSVPQLHPLFVISTHALSMCTRETHYPQLFVFQGHFCRIVDPALEGQPRDSADTVLSEHEALMVHGPFSVTSIIISEPHLWELLLEVSAF